MSAVTERVLVAVAILSAIIIFSVGIWLAVTHSEPELLNRSGALIVCVEGLFLVVEFARRTRLRSAEEQFPDNPYLLEESFRAERQMVSIGVTLAVAGEFLHGFGDILLGLAIN